jgi:hypothetical protein
LSVIETIFHFPTIFLELELQAVDTSAMQQTATRASGRAAWSMGNLEEE